MKGLVNTYKESGWLPEWASPGHRDCMIGSNSAPIIADAFLKGAVDADALLPFVNTAQQKYILNLVGTVLYNKLSDDIIANTPFTGRYLELMNDYIKPTLIWYSCVEYIPFSSIEFKPSPRAIS